MDDKLQVKHLRKSSSLLVSSFRLAFRLIKFRKFYRCAHKKLLKTESSKRRTKVTRLMMTRLIKKQSTMKPFCLLCDISALDHKT